LRCTECGARCRQWDGVPARYTAPLPRAKWEKFESYQSFDWALKRDPMKIIIGDRHIKTFPQKGSVFTKSFGYAPPDFDTDPNIYHTKHAEALEEDALTDVIDALPDDVEWNEYAKD
jgi:hypothetical protein